MGSPVSVVVAENVMQNIKEHAPLTCWKKISLWLRYVEDTFTAVWHDEIDTFHQPLKRQHTDIQFTREAEGDGKLPFLGSEVLSWDHNSLRTTIYRKLTHTDRLLDEPFWNPISHKAATIRTLHTSCDGRNVSHHYRQQFFLELLSTGRWDYTITNSKILVNISAARYQN